MLLRLFCRALLQRNSVGLQSLWGEDQVHGGTNSPSASECRQLARFAAGFAVRPEPSLDSTRTTQRPLATVALTPAAGFDQLSALVADRLATPLAAPWFEL